MERNYFHVAMRKVARRYTRHWRLGGDLRWGSAILWAFRNSKTGSKGTSGQPMTMQNSSGQWREVGRPALVSAEDLVERDLLEPEEELVLWLCELRDVESADVERRALAA